jgi:hypothetical protein
MIPRHVSVTCEMKHNGDLRWWLTKESGQLPELCLYGGWSGCCAWSGDRAALKNAYFVVKLESERPEELYVISTVIGISELSVVMVRRVAECVLAYSQPKSGLSEVVTSQRHHQFRGQYCTTGLRTSLGAILIADFVIQDSFCGVFPSDKKSWWRGVTDAAGLARRSGPEWMVCWGLPARIGT